MTAIDKILTSDPLVRLVQAENFVGYVFSLSYESALIITNDAWKTRVSGIPLNCFLLGATFDPEQFSATPPGDREVLLFRVTGTASLPQHDDFLKAQIDQFCRREKIFSSSATDDFDDFTWNEIQFGALECRIIGTFYAIEGVLNLGSDVESFTSASRLRVFKPRGTALEQIVNFVDPLRRQKAIEDAAALGFQGQPQPFRIGTIRYTSTSRLHRSDPSELVPVAIQPADFLARRTAVFGMTRTGKSNMIKQTIAVVHDTGRHGSVPIGQLIFDINGEYANPNLQDRGAIAALFPEAAVLYSLVPRHGMQDLRNNFYSQLAEGLLLLQDLLKDDSFKQADLEVFKSVSLEEPDQSEMSDHRRWEVRVALYKCLLHEAGFQAPAGERVEFRANANIRQAVASNGGPQGNSERIRLSLADGVAWFTALKAANHPQPLTSSSGRPWLDEESSAILNLLTKRNAQNNPIRGFRAIVPFRDYHSPRRTDEIVDEIYTHLGNGKIVVLDLALGPEAIRNALSKRIASGIFGRSMQVFISGQPAPNIVLYVEEAHNLIGKDADPDDTWPRIAKEGAKYRLGLVYATQEPSTMSPNVLANTENWFVTHLNNEDEVKRLSKFYDFADFATSLIRAQDVGFARVKMLSSPFVIPVQIDQFDISAWQASLAPTADGDAADGRPPPGRRV
jgi:hypothetical protein